MGDILKALCAALATLSAGLVLILQPGEVGAEIAAELPYAVEIGSACLAFGGLFLLTVVMLAVAPKSRATHFLRCLTICIATGLLAVGVAWGLGPKLYRAGLLAHEGEVTTAEVTGTRSTMGRGGPKLHLTVVYAGGTRGAVTIPGMPTQRRTSIDVVYAPSQPELVLPARGDTDFLSLVDQSVGLWGAALGALALLVLGGFSIAYFFEMWRTPRPDNPLAL